MKINHCVEDAQIRPTSWGNGRQYSCYFTPAPTSSPIPQRVRTVQQVYLHCHHRSCQVGCCSELVFPGEDLVCCCRKMQRTILGTLLTGEFFFCNLKSSMRIRKHVVKSFCMVPSYMCFVHNRMWMLDAKVYFLDQNYVFRINLVWFQLENVDRF